MATIPQTKLTQSYDEGTIVNQWTGFATSGDVGDPISLPNHSSKTFQVFGTFTGTPTIVIEGSNDGTNYVTLQTWQGTALSFTAAGMGTSPASPFYVRPRVTAGSGGAAITVTVASHRTDMAGMGR